MGVEFDDNNISRRDYGNEGSKGLSAWLISHNFVKTEGSAKVLQVLAALVFFGLAIYFMVK